MYFFNYPKESFNLVIKIIFKKIHFYWFLFVLRFYGPVNQWGHVERGQFT